MSLKRLEGSNRRKYESLGEFRLIAHGLYALRRPQIHL